eukprot:47468_1
MKQHHLFNNEVELKDGTVGNIRYIGNIMSKKGIFYGIDVIKGRGINNGSFRNIKYFDTSNGANTGRFCKVNKIVRSKSTTTRSQYPFELNDKVMYLKKKCIGTIKYIGIPPWTENELVYYGLELEEKKGSCNGVYEAKVQYFECEMNYGVYAPCNEVANINDIDQQLLSKSKRAVLSLSKYIPEYDLKNCLVLSICIGAYDDASYRYRLHGKYDKMNIVNTLGTSGDGYQFKIIENCWDTYSDEKLYYGTRLTHKEEQSLIEKLIKAVVEEVEVTKGSKGACHLWDMCQKEEYDSDAFVADIFDVQYDENKEEVITKTIATSNIVSDLQQQNNKPFFEQICQEMQSLNEYSVHPKLGYVDKHYFRDLMDDAKNELETKKYDGFIFIVTAHGYGNAYESIILLSKENEKETLEEYKVSELLKQFRTILGIPKIFICQACRGSEKPIPILKVVKNCDIEYDGPTNVVRYNNVVRYHPDEDVLLIQSNTPDNVSLGLIGNKQCDNGSYMITELMRLLSDANINPNITQKRLSFDDLIHILRHKTKKASSGAQIVQMTSTVIPKIYFIPN